MGKNQNHNSSATHQHVQRSTTLNRKYVHRPEGRIRHLNIEEEPQITSFAKCQAENQRRREQLAEKINRERLAAMKKKPARRISISDPAERTAVHKPIVVQEPEAFQEQQPQQPQPQRQQRIQIQPQQSFRQPSQRLQSSPRQYRQQQQFQQAQQNFNQGWQQDEWSSMPAGQSAQQLKDEAIRRAMRSVATMENQDRKSAKQTARQNKSRHTRRVALAVACSLAVVAGIGYFITVNMPDISTRVTALQSGISNPYPSYIPRGFSMITSAASDTEITMNFADSEGHKFSLSEEKSSWDSKALLSGYVDKKWTSYDTIKEQGLTIYIFGSSAAWVNGGIKYIITADNGVLTQKQIKNIATSL